MPETIISVSTLLSGYNCIVIIFLNTLLIKEKVQVTYLHYMQSYMHMLSNFHHLGRSAWDHQTIDSAL